MREQYLCDKNMFNVSAQGVFCGVFMPENVMKKIIKVEHQAMHEIRKILNDRCDELMPAEWTLANQKDDVGKILKQITIHYTTNNRGDVGQRIKLFKPRQPTIEDVYIVPDRKTAELIAEEILEEEMEGQ